MLTLAVLLAGFFALPCQAEVSALQTKEASVVETLNLSNTILTDYYQELARQYAMGSAPTIEQLDGWYTGRCFMRDAPAQPLNGLLLPFREYIGGSAGPAFPGYEAQKFILLQHHVKTDPALFDSITPELGHEIRTFYTGKASEMSVAEFIDGSLITHYRSGQITYKVRFTGDYFVAESSRGTDLAYCYYFRKVQELDPTLNLPPAPPANPPSQPCLVPGVPFPPGCVDG